MTSLTGSRGPTGSNTGQNMAGSNSMGKMPKAPSGYKRYQQYTPEQMQLFQQMMSGLGPDSFLSKLAGGDESQFEQMEAPAMRQFNALQGQNASRFSGMGMGARRGSGFKNEMDSATSNFAQDLQSRRMDYQRQAIQDLMGMRTSLLQQEPYGLVQKNKPWWQELLGGVAEQSGSLAKAGASYFGI